MMTAVIPAAGLAAALRVGPACPWQIDVVEPGSEAEYAGSEFAAAAEMPCGVVNAEAVDPCRTTGHLRDGRLCPRAAYQEPGQDEYNQRGNSACLHAVPLRIVRRKAASTWLTSGQ